MRRHLEDDEAVALISWRDLHAKRYPELALLIAIQNGGKRNVREAARLKRMGVRAGVSDYLLPVATWEPSAATGPRLGSMGLWLELKAGTGKPTPSQLEWLRLMREQGYATQVCTGWEAAAQAICDYLELKEIRP